MRLKVLYHDRCFDGLTSAALFSRFFLEKRDPHAEIVYQGLAHKPGEVFGKHSFDGDETVVVDLTSHQVVATWKPNCGGDGPRGLRVDSDAGLLFVACTTKVEALSLHNAGQIVGSVDAGEGVDDIDFSPTAHLLYIAAGKAGKL